VDQKLNRSKVGILLIAKERNVKNDDDNETIEAQMMMAKSGTLSEHRCPSNILG
jgi:hypothetical protein